MRAFAIGIALAGSVVFGAAESRSATLIVPDQFATIQAAIDAATPLLDDVMVRDGVYTENIVLRSNVAVASENGAVTTTIDGGGTGRTVDANGVVVDFTGFTVTGGSAATNGGGMRIINSSIVTVTSCVFFNNNAVGQGGGMSVQDSQANVQSCEFDMNMASGGAGAFVEGTLTTADVTFTDCMFHDNTATTGTGGAIAASNGDFTVSGGAIYANTATGGLGGGVGLDLSSTIDMSDCVIYNNEASDGGGLSFHNMSGGTVLRCTIYQNYAPIGGGLSCTNTSSPTITQTIIAGSGVSPKTGAASSGGINCGQTSNPTLTCCNLFGNAGGDALCGIDGGNNIMLSPEFCRVQPELEGIFWLQSDSPCAVGNSPCAAQIGRDGVQCGTTPVTATTWGKIKAMYQ